MNGNMGGHTVLGPCSHHSPEWWNGRHDGLKIRCSQGREGSNPSSGTTADQGESDSGKGDRVRRSRALTAGERRMPSSKLPIDRIAQAQGMVAAQADCSMSQARVLMEDRATVEGQSLLEIADAVLERGIRFGP